MNVASNSAGWLLLAFSAKGVTLPADRTMSAPFYTFLPHSLQFASAKCLSGQKQILILDVDGSVYTRQAESQSPQQKEIYRECRAKAHRKRA